MYKDSNVVNLVIGFQLEVWSFLEMVLVQILDQVWPTTW